MVAIRFPRPAPGNRHPYYGTLSVVGYRGFSWSSSVTNSDTFRLYFHNEGIYPNDYGPRAHGFPVRCLQE